MVLDSDTPCVRRVDQTDYKLDQRSVARKRHALAEREAVTLIPPDRSGVSGGGAGAMRFARPADMARRVVEHADQTITNRPPIREEMVDGGLVASLLQGRERQSS